MPTLRDVLIAYSNQQATTEQVWRALTEHSGWYVPAAFAVQSLHTTSSGGVTIFADEIPTTDHALILFTDAVGAGNADGAPIGVFMREFSGGVRVNSHSPKSEGWYIGQEAFPLARLWAQVVHLEQAIANAPSGTVPYRDLAVCRRFIAKQPAENQPNHHARDIKLLSRGSRDGVAER